MSGSSLATANQQDGGGYARAHVAIHWLTALLVFAIVPIAWYMTDLPRTDPGRAFWYGIHRSIGITILALAVLRVLVRLAAPPDRLPGTVPAWERGSAHAVHALLYAILFFMPVTGYLTSVAAGHQIVWFTLFTLPPAIGIHKPLAHTAGRLHVAGQWAVYTLVALHVLGAFHHLARRDGLVRRMLPG